MYDGEVSPTPVHMEHLASRDYAAVLLTGWKPPEENP